MDVKMKIWGLPKTEEEAIRFFQDKGLLPKTKQCLNGHNMTLYSFDKKPRWRCTSWACQKQVGLRVNTWFAHTKIPFVTAVRKYKMSEEENHKPTAEAVQSRHEVIKDNVEPRQEEDPGESIQKNGIGEHNESSSTTPAPPVLNNETLPVNGVNGAHDSDPDDIIVEEPEDPLANPEGRKRKISDDDEGGTPETTLNGERISKPVVIELDGTQEIKQAIAQHTEKKKAKKKKMEEDDGNSAKVKAEEVTERRASLRQRNAQVKLVEPDTPEESESEESEGEAPPDLPSVTITPAVSATSGLDPLSIEPVRKGQITIKASNRPTPALKQMPSVTITKTVPKVGSPKGPTTPGVKQNDKTTIVLVDTNSILHGKGLPPRSTHNLPPALSALYKSLPPGLSINQSPGLSISHSLNSSSPGLSITATPVTNSKPPMSQIPMLMGSGVTITSPSMAPVADVPTPPRPHQPTPFVQSLLTMDDTACIVEAPSFVAPYLIEKPGESIVKFLTNRQKELDELEKKFSGEEEKEKMEVDEPEPEKKEENKEEEPKEADADKNKEKPEVGAKEAKTEEKKEVSLKSMATMEKPASFFDSSIGKFFQDIGSSLVTEFVQNDFLEQRTRKAKKIGLKNLSSDERLTISSLEKAVEKSKLANEAFAMPIQKCMFCSFHTESRTVIGHHMETPHMMKFTYYCNFCQFDSREAPQILAHVETQHKIRGRLEKAPMAHQCIFCPFEDNLKSKVNRHIVTCLKRFKAEENLIPPLDWDPPAKVSKNAKTSFTNIKTPTPAATAAALNMLHPLMAKNQMLLATMQAHQAMQSQQAIKKVQQKQNAPKGPYRSPGGQQVFLPSNMAALQGNQLYQQMQGGKSRMQTPSISITPLPKAGGSPGGAAMITKGGVTVSPVASNPPGLRPGQPNATTPKQNFVVCEICDGYIKDLEQLRNHMQWIHKVKIHPKMIHNRPPLNCQKCQCRFFTDQGLERHLLGSHGLVTSSMQEAANRGQDAGRCPVCGKVYQWRLLTHVARDHNMTLKPAHLSYKCTVCTATFGMYKQFENHVYSAHSNVAKRGDKVAEAQKAAVKPGGKPLKINDEITIIPQPSKGETVTSMLKKSGVDVIPKGSVIVEPSKKDNCEFCSTKENIEIVEFKGNKVQVCKNCKKKLVNEDGVELLKKKNNVDIIDIDDEENNVSGREPASSRAGISIIPVKKATDSANDSSSSEEEDETKPAEPAKIVAPQDDLDLD
ncbi:uncharacterized protein LOC136033938 isoform X2 [Artemia franciscana]|uniref:uncharacterized protein LOC136033938 isoform X2 n=1 Tax=Artemia franciscana TaxID=6661 RepID=UPI0032DB8C63